jgi:hypothetical protein
MWHRTAEVLPDCGRQVLVPWGEGVVVAIRSEDGWSMGHCCLEQLDAPEWWMYPPSSPGHPAPGPGEESEGRATRCPNPGEWDHPGYTEADLGCRGVQRTWPCGCLGHRRLEGHSPQRVSKQQSPCPGCSGWVSQWAPGPDWSACFVWQAAWQGGPAPPDGSRLQPSGWIGPVTVTIDCTSSD